MKLEGMVTTYEQSKRIQELGFTKESMYYWFPTNSLVWFSKTEPYTLLTFPLAEEDLALATGSYTAEELAQILPHEIFKDKHKYLLNITRATEAWIVSYSYWDSDEEESVPMSWIVKKLDGTVVFTSLVFKRPTLAQAMGDMLIYLLEHGLLPKEE